MVFQSAKCQEMCSKNYAIVGILNRVKCPKTYPYEIEYFDMKLLFLITALNVKTRKRIRDDLDGLTYLTEWLSQKNKKNDRSDQQIDLICEILKILFNITITPNEGDNSSENEIEFRRLTSIARTLLLDYSTMKTEKENELISNVVNLLTNVPTACISELLVSPATVQQQGEDVKLFEGKCVLAADVLLQFLKRKLGAPQVSFPQFSLTLPYTYRLRFQDTPTKFEMLSPILTVLVKCVRSDVTLRHYIRSVILPPLRDVKKRPEEGNEFRNYLCRFLTSPYTQIRDLSAELLFVCCKENVLRMIKHTGYGNAAGLLANRGLMGGRNTKPTDYSSDSEDSDTEEYKEMQHGINPVIGCYEPPRPDPLAGMSDEQKEYEAVQLANLMDKLHRQGIIQPCRIGPDGKPEAVEHIQQLQEEIPQQQMDLKRKT